MSVCHLHLFHKTAVLRIHKVHLQVEGTADSGVSDDGGEDLGAVDLKLSKGNKLTKLGRCDRKTIELANHSNDNIVRTAGRASK